MEVIGRLRLGRDLLVHTGDRVGVERADGTQVDVEPTAERHRVGTPVGQFLVVEERVRVGGDDLVREHRGLGGVTAVHGDVTRLYPAQQRAHPVDVEGFVQRVGDRLADDEVVGDLDRPGDVLLTGRGLREQRSHEVIRLHALDRRRVLATVAEPQHQQGAVEVPSPARQEQG